LGNHDSYNAVKPFLPTTAGDQGSLYWSEEDEAFRYLFLDTSPDHLSPAQLQWLRAAGETEKQLAVFLHHPVLAVNTRVDTLYPLQNRSAVKDCLLQSKKPVVLFCGHYHMPHEQTEGTLQQIITPACSFQIVDAADKLIINAGEFGYRVITFDQGRFETNLKFFKSDAASGHVVLE
jgi:hypothetical protein